MTLSSAIRRLSRLRFALVGSIMAASPLAVFAQAGPATRPAASRSASAGPGEPPVTTLQPAVTGQRLPEVLVHGRAENLLGVADTANQGYVGHDELARRPLLRPAEILEAVPGLVITQHSGPGKANQYFLRGFQLDHGTDFAVTLAGVPQNLPTHAHGQGYLDLNYLIPELVSDVDYRKGPYFADHGDFSTAGSADIHYVNSLPHGFLDVEGGSFGYARTLVADSVKIGNGNFLGAGEFVHEDGPWDRPDAYKKINAVFSYTEGNANHGFSITSTDYHGEWRASNQAPQRAVDDGLIDRFGAIDNTDGANSQRYTIVAEAHQKDATTQDQILAWGTYYDLNMFSDFTYFLNNPTRGDQFEQQDARFYSGIRGSHTWDTKVFERDSTFTMGLQTRNDDIHNGLFDTQDRVRYNTVETAGILETSAGVYIENRTQWFPKFRTDGGLRGDYYNFHVHSSMAGNSGDSNAAIFSPKLNLIFGPWYKTEFYLSGGYGYHSNDARGITSTISPSSLLPANRVTPLVRVKGAEVGTRTGILPGLQSTATVWILDLDSELVFDGDTAESVPNRPSRRYGVEFSNFYTPVSWLTIDADYSLSRARYRQIAPIGNDVPESIRDVLTAGITVHDIPQLKNAFGGLRLRYFGPRPLIEDGSVRSNSSTLVDAQIGYNINENLTLKVDLLNLFNVKTDDIQYYYASRLPGEPAAGIIDRHVHPAEPIEARAGLTFRF